MLGIGLKLLGFGNLLKKFFLANWKWLVPLILAITAFLWTRDHYYDLGTDTERAIWEKKVADEAAKNKILTDLLANSVESVGELAQKETDTRVSSEVIRENRINTIIEEKPIYADCKIDQEVLDEQNAIKALGPNP